MGSPWVIPKQHPTKNISSTPTLIFEAQVTSYIDGLFVANQVDNDILFSLYLLREEGEPTPTEAVEYPLVLNKNLAAKESMDWIKDLAFVAEAGDLIFAYSDHNNNLFNTFVSYRKLTELAPIPLFRGTQNDNL